MAPAEHASPDPGLRSRLNEEAGRSNDIISDDEKHIVRELLSDAQGNLDALHLEIERIEASLAALRQQREAAVLRMTRFRVALSSEKLLPPELLSKIFLLALPGTETHCGAGKVQAPPWTFLRVCSRWRQAALGEHRIWQKLIVKMQCGKSVKALLHHLWSRSPSSYVSLNLKGLDDSDDINDILHDYSSQLRKLSLEAPARELAKSLNNPHTTFENLEFLCLKWLPDDVASVSLQSYSLRRFANAPILREVHITGHKTRLSADIDLNLPWSQLVDLQFTQVSFPIETIPSILSQCVKLTSLKVTLGTLHVEWDYIPPLVPSSYIVLPDLRDLTVVMDIHGDLDRLFQWLTAPLLKNISILHWGKVPKGHVMLYVFPHTEFTGMLQRSGALIEKFSLMCSIFDIDEEALLAGVPSLTSLSLHNANPVSERIFQMMRDEGFLHGLTHLTCSTTSPHSVLSLLERQCSHVTPTGICSGRISYNDTAGVRERFQALKQRLHDSGKAIKFVVRQDRLGRL